MAGKATFFIPLLTAQPVLADWPQFPGVNGSGIVDDMLIPGATSERVALVAVNKVTGKEVWRYEKLPASLATPAVLELVEHGQRELVFNVARCVYDFDPQAGTKPWEYAYGGEVFHATDDIGRFRATATVDRDRLFFRSDVDLYCVADESDHGAIGNARIRTQQQVR